MSAAETSQGTSSSSKSSPYTGTSARLSSRTPGSGHLHLSASTPHARFSTLSATYPLKLLAPTPLPSQPSSLATCYTLAYGGGLVAGDVIALEVRVDEGCGLVMLTQGSTKVFKHRPGLRPLSHQHVRRQELPSNVGKGVKADAYITKQRLKVILQPGALLLLLPDSVSPFRGSKYTQAQRFVLPGDRSASVLILDWVNSGRGYRPPSHGVHAPLQALSASTPGQATELSEDEEIWAMDSYASTNEVFVGDKLVMRERMVLDNDSPTPDQVRSQARGAAPPQPTPSLSSVASRLAPYHLYATILILGPHLLPLITHLEQMCDQSSQFQIPKPPGLIWAYSKTDPQGGVLRLAATEVEDAREWLRGVLSAGGVDKLVGEGLWPRCL